MRIIRGPRILPQYFFECHACGTQFVCGQDETVPNFDQKERDFFYSYDCPTCGKPCHSSSQFVKDKDKV